MIYLDNAATTLMKPPGVARAVADAINSFGNVGRGAHAASLGANQTAYRARALVAQLLGAPSPARVAFTSNVTEALNIVAAGLVGAGDHVVTTAASHNSILRPLFRAQDERDADVTVVPIAADGTLDYDQFAASFTPATKLAMVTHASNLTGNRYDAARIARICHEHGALCVVDAAQTAGHVPIDMTADGIDVLCFTGHKGLFGPQGTGGLCVAEGVEIPPFKEGGTGSQSYDRRQPTTMPDSLEAGTLNSHGIAGLAAGIEFILETGVEAIGARECTLAARLRDGISALPGVTVYGDPAQPSPIVAFNINDADSDRIADALSFEFGICTRAGAHCAPLMHRALGTQTHGAVRASFSYFNTEEDADATVAAIYKIAKS